MKEIVLKKLASSFKKLQGAEKIEGIEANGDYWKVGLDGGGRLYESIGDLQDLINKYPIFIKYLHSINVYTDKMILSLPTTTYRNAALLEKDNKDNIIRKLKDNVKNINPNVKEIEILPQGLAAVYEIFGKGKLKPGRTLIFDGGFNTLNVTIIDIDDKNEYNLIYARTYYDELGIRSLLDTIFREELLVHNEEMSSNLQVLKDIFLKGRIDQGFKTIDVKKEKENSIQIFLQKLFKQVLEDLQKEKITFDQFSFVGGLSYYIKEEDIESDKLFYIPKKDGEFQTVLGMNKYYPDYTALDLGFGDGKYIERTKEN